MNVCCTHQSHCRLCLGRNLDLVVKLEPIPLASHYAAERAAPADDALYPTDLYLCRDCGHVQILDIIDPAVLWEDYAYRSGQTKGILDHFEAVAASVIARHHPPAGSLVVDIGSNDGSLLRPFKRRGHRVLGVDPVRYIAAEATASGIETVPEGMTPALAKRIVERHGPASVVTAFNVFAHAPDMGAMAQSIHDLLAPDGVFLFEAQYLLDIVDHVLLGTIFHEHMSHHSVAPMQRFLARHGMELIDVERVSIQRGSIIGTAQRRGGPRPVQPSVAAHLALERERGLDRPEALQEFGARLGRLRQDMDRLRAEWTRRGATVAAYGAARSGPTLIVQFGLGGLIDCIFDDHPQKVNRFSPYHRIPVLPTRTLMERKPDYVIILAYLHARSIVASNRAYLEQGGHFVTCCPDVRVIGADSAPPK
ncbi:MAG: class I SAM-dependent methyltransferase [Lentisphaerae bacterium]|nr:class I SAM-dependent methyltransferase [Lentisphaerota bacterium]